MPQQQILNAEIHASSSQQHLNIASGNCVFPSAQQIQLPNKFNQPLPDNTHPIQLQQQPPNNSLITDALPGGMVQNRMFGINGNSINANNINPPSLTMQGTIGIFFSKF